MIELTELQKVYANTAEPTASQINASRTALQQSWTTHRLVHASRLRLYAVRLAGGVAAAALLAVVVSLFVAAPFGREAVTAAGPVAELLTEVRAGAATVDTTRLPGPGEYSYLKRRQAYSGDQRFERTLTHKERKFIVVSDESTQEIWSSSIGRLRILESVRWQPKTTNDRATWHSVGSPDLATLVATLDHAETDPTNGVSSDPQNSPTSYQLNNGPVDLTAFTGRPAELADALREGFAGSGPDPNTELFTIGSDILTDPVLLPARVRRTVVEMLLTEVQGIEIDPNSVPNASGVLVVLPHQDYRDGVVIDPTTAEVRARLNAGVILERGITPSVEVRPDGTSAPLR